MAQIYIDGIGKTTFKFRLVSIGKYLLMSDERRCFKGGIGSERFFYVGKYNITLMEPGRLLGSIDE